jgi:hypothetical protein
MNSEQFTSIFMAASEEPTPKTEEKKFEAERFFAKVREELRRLDDAQQFDILFPVAVKQQWNAPSYTAALLLRELSPACPFSCEDAVRALLPEWDVSIEEVPFYLAARFGPTRIRQAIANLEPGVTDKSEKVNLETVAYWLDAYEATYPSINS